MTKRWTWRNAARRYFTPGPSNLCGRKILLCASATRFGPNIPVRASAPPHGMKSGANCGEPPDEDFPRGRVGGNGYGRPANHSSPARAPVVSGDGAGGFGALRGEALRGNCAVTDCRADAP